MSNKFLALGSKGFGTYEVDLSTHSFERVEGTPSHFLVPGFVDIHTHGAFGIDFMSASLHQMEQLCDRLRLCGYEKFLPTTVTAFAPDIRRALNNLPEHEMIAGFHLEGPFISPTFPGAQPKEAIVDPPIGISEWDDILDHPRLKVITLAPERPGAPDLITRLAKRGVRVSIGHTNATYSECASGFVSGASHATHTFNAMRPLHHREPGTVGFVLENDEIYAELIYDRLHVRKEVAEILFRCKTPDRVIAISDSVMAAGMSPGQVVRMWNLDVVVGDREVRLKDGTLAGSGITLLDAFRNLCEDFGPERAIRATSINPRAAIGLSRPPSLYVELDQKLDIVALHSA